jgi:hypothetical protein
MVRLGSRGRFFGKDNLDSHLRLVGEEYPSMMQAKQYRRWADDCDRQAVIAGTDDNSDQI